MLAALLTERAGPVHCPAVWRADMGITRIMTLDKRDFSRYRLPDGRAFEIL